MSYLSKNFFLIFILSSIIYPQQINSIEISGNTFFDNSRIIEWSRININEQVYPGILDSIKNRIAHQLALRGYLNSSFNGTEIKTTSDSGIINLIISVSEGNPSYINKVFIDYPDSLKILNIIEQFNFLEDQVYDKTIIENTIQETLTYFENNGYPFIRIIVESIIFYRDTISNINKADLYLKLDPNRKSFINEIQITGNEKTKDYVIKRALRIDPGEEYSQQKMDELPRRLNRLRFFDPVEPPEFYVNSREEGVLLIKIKEKQTNNFDGIIGYIPSTQPGESGYLTGLVNISLRNIFGTGRAVAVRWQQFNRYSQEMELKYLEPWLFGYPFNLNGSFFQRKQDTSYVQRRFEGGLEFLATEDISASFFIAAESVIPAISENSPFTVYNSNSFTTGVNLTIDARDDPYAPTEGLIFLNSYSISRKKISGPERYFTPDLQTQVNLQRIEVSINTYYELFKRQIVALGLNGKELRGPFFEVSDLFRLGGNNNLRGYREDQFFGSRIFWSNLEYRLLLTRRTFGFLFFDTGYFLKKEEPSRNISKLEDFKIGYGVGLNIETGLGVLGVSFGLAEGDSFSDGKIHFGLINEF